LEYLGEQGEGGYFSSPGGVARALEQAGENGWCKRESHLTTDFHRQGHGLMTCSFTEKISSLIDGELSPAEAREVERHLVTCAQCEEARADFLSLRSQIASFEP